MITSPNVEGTNDLTNSSRGSGTPPWIHHTGPTMAARAWPKPSPRPKTFSCALILDPRVSLAQVCAEAKTFRHRGASVGGIRNQAFRALKIKESFSHPDSCTKDPEAKSLKPLNLSSSLRGRFSA
jgi:hypothetical protein